MTEGWFCVPDSITICTYSDSLLHSWCLAPDPPNSLHHPPSWSLLQGRSQQRTSLVNGIGW